MSYDDFEALDISVAGGVVTCVIARPPMNLLSPGLMAELDRFTEELAADPEPLVVVLKSSTPGFFLGHAPYENIDLLAGAKVPDSPDEVQLNRVHLICNRLREMDKVTVAQIEGRATGGGATIAMACDLRYGAVGLAVFNSFGVPMATGLGGGATQYLPRLIGRSRAMEVILGGLDLDATTAESWGYLTRAFAPEDIDGYVRWITSRIAAAAAPVVRNTKVLIHESDAVSLEVGLRNENFHLQRAIPTDAAIQSIRDFLALGGETVDGESRLQEVLGGVLLASGRMGATTNATSKEHP